jgi:branched-chain amino acid transport system permease protein
MATNVATAPLRARRTAGSYVMPLVASLLVLGLFAWLVVNFVKGPAYFTNIAFIGLTNGAVYALVALGYTLVYGILELINFAHGDVFMLGGLISATMIDAVFGVTTKSSTGYLILAIVCTLGIAMLGCGVLNAAIERVAYRPWGGAPPPGRVLNAHGKALIRQ